jgi:hypothetical protein
MSMNIHLSATSVGQHKCEHCGRSDEIKYEHFDCWQTPTMDTNKILDHHSFQAKVDAYAKWVTSRNPTDASSHLKHLDEFIEAHGDKTKWDMHWYSL